MWRGESPFLLVCFTVTLDGNLPDLAADAPVLSLLGFVKRVFNAYRV